MSNFGGSGRWSLVLGAWLALSLSALMFSSCGVRLGATEPSVGPTLLKADRGWTSVGGPGFLPLPFKRSASLHDYEPMLVGATGSKARVKWLADRAEAASPQDARSTLTVRVVSVTDPTMRADVEFRGAGGAGFADLPIEAGKRTVYRVTFTATGTYRWCSVMIEVRK